MAHPNVLPSNLSVAAADPVLLGEQTMSSIFSNIVHIYRHHFRVLFYCSALPMLPLLLLMEVLKFTAPQWVVVASLLYMVGAFVVSGALTITLSDICLNNRPSVRRSYARVLGGKRWWHLISTAFVYIVGCYLGLLLLILPGLWLLVRGFFGAIVVALEGRRNRDALRRSIALTKGQVWRILGLTLPFFGFIFVFSAVLTVTALALPVVAAFLISVLGNFVLLSVFTPAVSLTLVLLYYEQRVRRESYDAHALSEDLMR